MTMSQAQKVGVGALLGGVGTMGASMLLRYYADNKPTSGAGTADAKFPVWWEQAPLVGIVAGAAATGLAYYLWGTEAAVGAGVAAIFAGVAPTTDAWALEKRGEADAKKLLAGKKCGDGTAPAADGTCADGTTPAGLRGGNVRALGARLASLQAQLNAVASRAA
jgi:hypothetical protein